MSHDAADMERECRLAEHRDHYREVFDLTCLHAERFLSIMARFYIRGPGTPGGPSPKAQLFRDQATVFLSHSDRIKNLKGKEFSDAATAAFDAFTSMDDMDAVTAEIHAQWTSAPFRTRLSIRLRNCLRNPIDQTQDLEADVARLEARLKHADVN